MIGKVGLNMFLKKTVENAEINCMFFSVHVKEI